MWVVTVVYEIEGGTMLEATHTFDKSCMFSQVLLALHDLHEEDVVTDCQINFVEKNDTSN